MVFAMIVFFVLWIVLNKLEGKKRKIFSRIIVTITMCLYIQGNFLNRGYSVLDGQQVQWNSMIKKGIVNTLIWVLMIIFPYCLKKFKEEKIFWRYQLFVISAISLVEMLTLCIVITGMNSSLIDSNYANKDYYLDQSNVFNLSEKNNIIVFVSDTFEGTYMNEILEKYPEYKDKLADFTYFQNTTTTATQTFESMPIIMTGEELQIGKNLQENLDYCFKNTNIYDVLKENNYTTEIYTEPALIPVNLENDVVSNKVNSRVYITEKSKIKLTKKLYKMVLYRYGPHFLKKNFFMYSNEWNDIDTININRYELDDVYFNKMLKKGVTTNYDTNSFKIYHLNGMHVPYTITTNIENCTENYFNNVSEEERRINQGIASLKILINYIKELKEKGIYDNTTILFFADHGWLNRYYPVLLVKPSGYSGEFKVSNAPISLLDDLKPTILNVASNSKEYGKDIWDYEEGENRTRRVLNYTFTRGDNIYNVLSKLTLETDSHASKLDKYKIVKQEELEKNIEKSYEIGKEINFLKSKNIEYVSTIGILNEDIREACRGYTTSTSSKIKIKRRKSNSDVTATMHINDVFYKDQKVIIKSNDEILYEKILKKGSNLDITFKIPKKLWNKNEEFELEIETPDAVFGNPEILGQETIYMSLWIEKIIFKN